MHPDNLHEAREMGMGLAFMIGLYFVLAVIAVLV